MSLQVWLSENHRQYGLNAMGSRKRKVPQLIARLLNLSLELNGNRNFFLNLRKVFKKGPTFTSLLPNINGPAISGETFFCHFPI